MPVSLPVAIIFTILIIAIIIFSKVRRVIKYSRYAPIGDDIKEGFTNISDQIEDLAGGADSSKGTDALGDNEEPDD